jgi:hypothetical protein
MKIVPNRILALLVLVLTNAIAFAAPNPPPPTTPPPPGAPIDSGLFLLVIGAMIIGIYKIYKNQNIKKASN